MESNSGVQWNMAGLLNEELARLTIQANIAFTDGQFKKAINLNIAKRTTAGFTFTKEERDMLIDKEKELFNLISSTESIGFGMTNNQLQKYKDLKVKYLEYVTQLHDILDNYGWFGARKKDASKMIA